MFSYFYPRVSVNPILLAAAIIPAVVLLVFVYRADRLEKESPRMLLLLLVFGVIAAIIAMVCERVGTQLLGLFVAENTVQYNAIMYFGIVAFSEEGAKYAMLKLRTWKSPEFNCRFDGVVYAVFVSLGFALFENILYVFSYGLNTALLRAVTAIPGHACFGVFMGVWYGMAKQFNGHGQEQKAKLCRVLAVLLPALLHGCYDFIATMQTGLSWIFVIFILAMFVAAFFAVRRMSRKDSFLNNPEL